MKTIRAILAPAMLVLLASAGSLAHAEDWTTIDGKVYKRIQVLKFQGDTVTILYADGAAEVPFAKLPPDLQERLKEWAKTPAKKIIGEPKQPKGNEQ